MSHILFIYCYILLSQYHTGQFLLVTIYKYEKSVRNCGMSHDWWLCTVRDRDVSESGVRIGSPSCYQGVDQARGTQVDIQSEEKASSDCMTIYKVVRKLPDHVTLSGTWYGP